MEPIVITPATPATTVRGFSLADLFSSPLVRHVAGVLLTLALGYLSLKLGIAPVPVPTLPPITLTVQAAPGLVATQAK